jgi:hypothetical protein
MLIADAPLHVGHELQHEPVLELIVGGRQVRDGDDCVVQPVVVVVVVVVVIVVIIIIIIIISL